MRRHYPSDKTRLIQYSTYSIVNLHCVLLSCILNLFTVNFHVHITVNNANNVDARKMRTNAISEARIS